MKPRSSAAADITLPGPFKRAVSFYIGLVTVWCSNRLPKGWTRGLLRLRRHETAAAACTPLFASPARKVLPDESG